MSNHLDTAHYMANVQKYFPDAKEPHVKKIVNYLGVTLMNNDAKLVSCSDAKERERVRDGFAAKKLGMSASDAEAAIEAVCQHMKEDRQKPRVTFLYALAKNAGKLDEL